MSNVLPSGQPPAASTASAGVTGTNASASPSPAATYVEPTAGEILHQMFVTGDPNNPPKPAPGRVADRPAQ